VNPVLANKISVGSLERVFRKKKYILEIGSQYVNVFGIRASTGFTNTFDDIIGAIYRDVDDVWAVEIFAATTEPGKHYMQNPMNVDGAGIMVPDQYPGLYEIGKHKNQYSALVQVKPVKVFRDSNRDLRYDLDPKTIKKGKFGANLHRAHEKHKSTFVDRWSAACQVVADPTDYDRLMMLCETHSAIYSNSFNYTLLEEKDFDDGNKT
jgi:hypothetical protein